MTIAMVQEDIFDKIMHLPGLRMAEGFYKKNKEVLLYLFFGGLAFLVSIGTYVLFNVSWGMNELIANIFSWIITVLFAFFTNRIWVFQARTNSAGKFVKQLFSFYAGRLITLMVEEVMLLIFITCLGFSSIFVKIIAQIVVIVLNYVISKVWVFTPKKLS